MQIEHERTVPIQPPPRRKSRKGLWITLITLCVLIILLVVGALIGRSIAHDYAYQTLDQALASGVNQVPGAAAIFLDPGTPIVISEANLTNMVALNISPNDPIKAPKAQISPSEMQYAFQISALGLTLDNTIHMKPVFKDGKLKVENLTLEGPISWIFTADELTDLFNRHLADAQQKIARPLKSVELKQHQLVLTLG